jgi:hypothetical protein
VSGKQPGSSSHAGLSGLGSNLARTTDDYISASSRGYGTDYTALERRHYGEHHAGYMPREMPTDLERRYADPIGHSHQVLTYDLCDFGLGFFSSLPQFIWDQRLCCCCVVVCILYT